MSPMTNQHKTFDPGARDDAADRAPPRYRLEKLKNRYDERITQGRQKQDATVGTKEDHESSDQARAS